MTSALSIQHASKRFGPMLVLEDVSLEIEPGEVRALVGQNGSGKSTLIKILAGLYAPEPGIGVQVDGTDLHLQNPTASEAAGLRFVHQDLGLVLDMDAVDNMALADNYITGWLRMIRWSKSRKAVRQALADLGYQIDVTAAVGHLAMSERTAVAIARAISVSEHAAKVLVLDEPTANLPGEEAERLHALVRRVANSGMAVLFVSHHFDEVFEMADTVTVLRDGRLVATQPVRGVSESDLIAQVVGRDIERFAKSATEREHGEIVLETSQLRGAIIDNVDLSVRRGEVVGVAGVTGSGREEIAQLIFGGRRRHGEVVLQGKSLPQERPDISISRGMGMVPAERHANASLMEQTLRENITIVSPERHWVAGFMRGRREAADVSHWLGRFDVRPRDSEAHMFQLSGGNQQKTIVLRWLREEPTVLIFDEPTQGVDIGSKADIHGFIAEAAAQGSGILIVSTDHDELVQLCDRVLILQYGRITDELSGDRLSGDGITAATIGRVAGMSA